MKLTDWLDGIGVAIYARLDERYGGRAYNVAAIKHFGEFALLNDILGMAR